MITFDALTLKAFTEEQKDILTGARINKIQQPTRREFIFTIRTNGKSRQLYINIDSKLYHICFMTESGANKRLLEIPPKPPMFCMQLRKYLENSRIAKVRQVKNERILEFYIETYNEIGEKIYLCLAIEFMGKHSNVILYNTDTNLIIGCAHNVGAEKSKEREIYGGIPYIYPPKQKKSDFIQYKGEIDYQNLDKDFYLFSKNFGKLCYGLNLNEIKDMINLKNISPAITKDYLNYNIFSNLLDGEITKFPTVNDMLDEYYSYYIYQEKYTSLKNKYYNLINQKLKKLKQSISKMLTEKKAGAECDKYRLYGDLLLANSHNLKDFINCVNVYDYENNIDIKIPLDETKTIKDNANKYYKLYNKAKTAQIKLTSLIDNKTIEKQNLEQILYSINSAQNITELKEISNEIEPQNKQNNKNKPSEIMCLELENNTKIYIGKNNKQNDYIISKLASDEDIWFHVHNNAGSHILLKTQNITDKLIIKCAKLAKEYSSVKNSPKIGVIYTKRKYLRKPPGANLGYVTYKNEKEIIIDNIY